MSKQISEHAHAAKLIRKELKAAFPYTKFSVKSDSYSMGSSVRIAYEDGPASDAVNEIVSKYEYGSFDGMNDLYTIDNNNPDLPQVKYVIVNRSISEANREVIESKLIEKFGIENPESESSWYDIFNEWKSTVVWRAFTGVIEI